MATASSGDRAGRTATGAPPPTRFEDMPGPSAWFGDALGSASVFADTLVGTDRYPDTLVGMIGGVPTQPPTVDTLGVTASDRTGIDAIFADALSESAGPTH